MHRFQEHPIVTCSINDLHSAGGRNTGSSYTIPAMSPRVECSGLFLGHVKSRLFAAGGANEFTLSTRSKVEISNINGEAESSTPLRLGFILVLTDAKTANGVGHSMPKQRANFFISFSGLRVHKRSTAQNRHTTHHQPPWKILTGLPLQSLGRPGKCTMMWP